ncbi:hypothetical protein BGZ51_009822 [Haplosporangium sp. Z 767]|nr:hypothetical protein BGZ51_009822 [Haplosporangium sp. Z 767]
MADHNTTLLAPNGCPIHNHPEDPTRLFSSNGLTLDLPRIGWIAAGCCTLLSTIISFVLIYRHLQYYTKPNQQRYIVRMLLMVPIYAITSWFSFVYVREAIFFDSIRILYEAFVIASFLILMLQYLGDSLEDQKRALKKHKKTERWFFPMCCLKYNPSRPHFLQYMKWGILQYVPLQIIGTILTIVLEINGSYCESSWNPKFGHVWILGINLTAVTIATYFLIMFYLTIREDLKEYSPFYKFMAVKLVVFFSFWQMVLVEGLVYFGLITATTYWTTDDIAVGINAMLIDFEMVFFALMHVKAFSHKPYVPMIPNPEHPLSIEASLLTDDDKDANNGRDTARRNRNRSSQSLVSISLDRPTGDRIQSSRKRQPSDSESRSKASGKNKDKEKGKDKGPPEKIMDFTQKTPIWKGLLDSFNPLDTIRELAYGLKYLYRWSRGIPVDKDSRRLLDLERAFGRQRPEVPYIPPKDEDKKKKKKKKKKTSQESSDESTDQDKDDDKDYDRDDDDYILDKDDRDDRGDRDDRDVDRRRKGRDDDDLEKGYRSGVDGASGQGLGGPHEVRRYKQFQDPLSSRVGIRNSPKGSVRGEIENNGRKPIESADTFYNPSGSGSGKDTGTKTRPKKKTVYLDKEAAAQTERATLPDIQPTPVMKKIALSGFYEDLPLSPVLTDPEPEFSADSSLEIPMPVGYHQQHPSYESHDSRPRDWERERERDRVRGHDHRIDMSMDSTRFEHRDLEIERAAASYAMPAPPVPLSTRPNLAAGSVHVPPGAKLTENNVTESIAALSQPASKNMVTRDDSFQHNQELEHGSITGTVTGKNKEVQIEARDPRTTAAYFGNQGRERFESGGTSAQPGSISLGQFYHHREGSYSDPELSHYSTDFDHDYEQDQYFDRMRYMKDQVQPKEDHQQPQSQQRTEPTPPSGSTNMPHQALTHQRVQQLQQQHPATPRYPDPRDEQDPIVAQYNQIFYRQKLQEQQRQQYVGNQQERLARPLLRRRNSLDSLDSDSSGGFRVRGGRYDHNYGYGPARPRQSRYQRAYRYPIPLPQPVPPVQVYRFPEDRALYEQRKREKQQQQQQQQAQQPKQQQSFESPSRLPPMAQNRDTRSYRSQQQQQYSPQHHSRPYQDYPRYSSRNELPSLPFEYGRSDSGYRSTPPQEYDYRQPWHSPRPGESSTKNHRSPRDHPDERVVDSLFPASRYAAPFVRDYELQQREGRRRTTQDPMSGAPSPQSARYQPRQRQEQLPPRHSRQQPFAQEGSKDRVRNDGGYENDGNDSRYPSFGVPQPRSHRQPQPHPQPPAASSTYEDDGPYEEAIVWTRPPPEAAVAPMAAAHDPNH